MLLLVLFINESNSLLLAFIIFIEISNHFNSHSHGRIIYYISNIYYNKLHSINIYDSGNELIPSSYNQSLLYL